MLAQHLPAASPFTLRLWLAFAALPPVNAALAYLGFPLVWAMGGHSGRLTDPAGAAFGFALISGVFGFIVTWAGAVPLVAWLAKRGAVSFRQTLVAGVVLGNAPFGAYVLVLVLPATVRHLVMGTMSQHLMPLSDVVTGTLRALLIGSAMGAASGAVLWFAGIRERDGAGRSELP
jgi:hypothetical protein